MKLFKSSKRAPNRGKADLKEQEERLNVIKEVIEAPAMERSEAVLMDSEEPVREKTSVKKTGRPKGAGRYFTRVTASLSENGNRIMQFTKLAYENKVGRHVTLGELFELSLKKFLSELDKDLYRLID